MSFGDRLRAFANWLARPVGFAATLGTVVFAAAAGLPFHFSDEWLLAFNLYLSIAAIVIGGVILVAGRAESAALHAKLDTLIRAIDKANDDLIRAESKTDEEIERLRERC